ncbi:MAG: hypothetical protein ABS944_15610 [Solibacillus sp.]|uniref:hypothetical protein n=1 Tax=unclassified Solibacillus TaxID=2637870 RepID=UPI0030F6936F
MGKIVMPKNSALLNEIESVLHIYYEANDWLTNTLYKERLKEMIGPDQYQSSYTKKAQITSYFGFTVWEDINNAQSRRRITESGKKMYEAITEKSTDKIQDVLMNALETVKFGRHNYGCPESDSDVEPPALYIRAILDLGYLTYKEFAFLLWKLEDVGGNYTDTLDELRQLRNQGPITLSEEANKYSDCKPIMILMRWGFLDEDDDTSGGKHIIIKPEVLRKYGNRLKNLKIYNIDMDVAEPIVGDDLFVHPVESIYKTSIKSDFQHNRIIFGAPGTGKSYELNRDKDTLLKNGGEYERVTFHPDYSYANFVGTYKPTMLDPVNDHIVSEDEKGVLSILLDDKTAQEKYDLLYDKFKEGDLTRLPLLLGLYNDDKFKTKKKDGSNASGDNSVERNHGRAIRPYVNLISNKKSASEIVYEYVPGPFMRTYVKALKNAQTDNPKPYLLIVEEINRANVAAVFGDVFQLLDRDDDNVSEYAIQTSEDIKKYLAKELGGKPQEYSEIKIPNNMFIWATMNSADQGVYPMDTAFKRRWNFDYLSINHNENDIKGNFVTMGSEVYLREIEWNELRKAINNTLSSYKINEDKLLGPYFLSRKVVVPRAGNKINADIFISAFKSKVLMYLFDDAAKQKRASLFDGCKDTTKYSSICEEFDKRGVEIFCKEIREKFPRATAIAGVAESVEEYK